jgi:hypothetical protein
MKVLIAILSYNQGRQHHELIRNTWLQGCKTDYKFILGNETKDPQQDELVVDSQDTYYDLIFKVEKSVEYALINNYDYLFRCDLDTYVCIDRLLRSGFEQHDWSGYGEPYGGSGYWLSRKATQALIDNTNYLDVYESEDTHVARILRQQGFTPFQDRRYYSSTNEGPSLDNDLITSHWYVEVNAVRNGKIYDRRIDLYERLRLIPVYHEKAKFLK